MLQATNTWPDELVGKLGPQRHSAWHALEAVLRRSRDRLTIEFGPHLSAQLSLLVRGADYDQFQPVRIPERYRSGDGFLSRAAGDLRGTPRAAVRSGFAVLNQHVAPELIHKVKEALPEPVRALWPAAGKVPPAIPATAS